MSGLLLLGTVGLIGCTDTYEEMNDTAENTGQMATETATESEEHTQL